MDITQKESEHVRLLKARINALKAQQLDFLYHASHDLQAPLRKLSSFTDLLVSQFPDTGDDKPGLYKKKIQKCIVDMRRLLERLALLNESILISPSNEDCNLNKITRKVIDDLQRINPGKIINAVIENLPIIQGNFEQFEQLFTELLGNAIMYSRPAVPVELHIYASELMEGDLFLPNYNKSRSETHYKIIVADNGIGIRRECLKEIFLPFHKGDGVSGNGGNGLGLALSSNIVENHGGIIYAESDENNTELILILPAKQVSLC